MANQQLVDYIKAQLAAGVTKPDLQKAVTTAGWSMQDSNEAFLVAEGKAPMVSQAPAQPMQPVQPVQMAQPAPATIRPMGAVAATPNPRITPQIEMPERSPARSLWLWVVLAVVLLFAAAAAAYQYVPAVHDIVTFYLGGGVPVTPTPAAAQTDQTPVAPAPDTASTTAPGGTLLPPPGAANGTTTLMQTGTTTVSHSATTTVTASSTAH